MYNYSCFHNGLCFISGCYSAEPPKATSEVIIESNHSYDSRDDFVSPIGIIAMIDRPINYGYDSRDDFNGPLLES